MPNQPKTPSHSVRMDEDLWTQLGVKAQEKGEDRTAVLVRAAKRYVKS